MKKMYLECNPPLEVILHRLKTRIDILIKAEDRFNPTLMYLKKDYEDLERCLDSSIVIE